MKLELARDLFRHSWDRRDQLTGSVATPITVLTGVGGAVVLLGASFWPQGTWSLIVFIVTLGLSVSSLILATFFVARSYHGYSYEEIPNALDLDAHCVALQEYHKETGGSAADADADFDEYLSGRFVEAADVNSRNNVSKAAYLYRASQWLIVSIVSTAIAVVPWTMGRLSQSPEPQRVTLESPVRILLPLGERRAHRQLSASGAKSTDTSVATDSHPSAGGTAKSPNPRGGATPSAPGTAARPTS